MLEEHTHGLGGSIQDTHQCFESTDSPCTAQIMNNKMLLVTQHRCPKYPHIFSCGLVDSNWGRGRKMSFSLRGLPDVSSWNSHFEPALPKPRQRYRNDADRQHHQPDRVIGVEISPYPNFDVALRWIHECQEKHPACGSNVRLQNTPISSPTRNIY